MLRSSGRLIKKQKLFVFYMIRPYVRTNYLLYFSYLKYVGLEWDHPAIVYSNIGIRYYTIITYFCNTHTFRLPKDYLKILGHTMWTSSLYCALFARTFAYDWHNFCRKMETRFYLVSYIFFVKMKKKMSYLGDFIIIMKS